MWSCDVAEEVVEIFEEAQLFALPKRHRFQIEYGPRVTLRLVPRGDHVCADCGYSAHTFQQLHAHRYWHSKRLKIAV